VADAADPVQVEALFAQVRPDHVVVTASASGNASGIPQTSPEAARGAFERFWISYHVLHFASRYVSRQGSVTLLSGSSGKTPAPGYGFWGTLHGCLEALAHNAALELAPLGSTWSRPGALACRPTGNSPNTGGSPKTWQP
jgi:NAD(P)-dependent dehydrogenase (short-subunit alcohol dehydrogenase family)